MTAAQDEGGRRKTLEQGAERFMAKRIAPKKDRAKLRRAVVVVWPSVTGKTKGRIARSKRVRAARHSCLATSGANLYPPGV